MIKNIIILKIIKKYKHQENKYKKIEILPKLLNSIRIFLQKITGMSIK